MSNLRLVATFRPLCAQDPFYAKCCSEHDAIWGLFYHLLIYFSCSSCRYARERAGIELLVGFETEVILLSSTDPDIVAINNHGWCDALALPSGSLEARVTREIADNLQRAGIALEMYHAEAAPGQVSSCPCGWFGILRDTELPWYMFV